MEAGIVLSFVKIMLSYWLIKSASCVKQENINKLKSFSIHKLLQFLTSCIQQGQQNG